MPPEATATDPSAVTPPAPPAPPAAPPQSSVSLPTEAFNERIAQAKRSATTEAEANLLKTLGVTDIEAAKAAIKAANEAADKNKTAEQRALEFEAKYKAEKERGDALESIQKEQAAAALAELPQAQRDAVIALAGDDAAAQILAIKTLRPTWAASAAPTATPQAPPKVAPPIATAPPRDAPAPTPGGEPDHFQVYKAMKDKNPYAAAQYRRQHAVAISAGEQKQS